MTDLTFRFGRRVWKPSWRIIERRPSQGINTNRMKSAVKISQLNTRETSPNLPDWKGKIARKQSATTTLLGTHAGVKMHRVGKYQQIGRKTYAPTRDHYLSVEGFLYTSDGSPFNLTAPSTAGSLSSRNAAAANFVSKYTDEIRSFGALNFFGELRETVQLFRRPLSGLYKETWAYARRVRRLRHVRSYSRHLYAENMSRAWLAYTMAIEPLGLELADYAIALHRLANELGSQPSIRINGFGKEVFVQDASYGVVDCPFAEQTVRQQTVTSSRYTGAITRIPSNISIPEFFGASLRDVVPTAWELIPMSFIADYFTNTGDVLNALCVNQAYLAWCELGEATVKTTTASDLRIRHVGSSANMYDVIVSGGTWEHQAKRVTRVPSSFPQPVFEFQVPGLLKQYLNIGALLQLWSASKPRR